MEGPKHAQKSEMREKVIEIMLGWIRYNESIETTADKQLNIPAVSTRLFGVYDRNGNIKSVYREPYNAFEEATKLNRQLVKDEYFIDWVIVG